MIWDDRVYGYRRKRRMRMTGSDTLSQRIDWALAELQTAQNLHGSDSAVLIQQIAEETAERFGTGIEPEVIRALSLKIES